METKAETPMSKVWVVVLSTMVITALLVYVWHLVVMRSIDGEHKLERAELHAQLNELIKYRDQLRVGEKATITSLR